MRKEVAIDQPGAPELADTPLPKKGEPSPKRTAKLLVSIAILLLFGGTVFLAMRPKSASVANSALPNAQQPAVVAGLRLKGTTEAVQARVILTPAPSGQQASTLTITKLALAGAHVRRGDLLVEFDRQGQIRDFLDKQAEYDKLSDQVLQEKAKEDTTRATDETALRQAESDLTKAGLEMQKLEILSRIEAEKAQETLEEDQATLQQLRQTFELKRKAAQAAIRILEIQRDRTRQTMLHAQVNAELLQIHAPIDGVVVLETIWKQGRMGTVQEGDQVRPGTPFMQVVDPSEMQVRVSANQTDILTLKIGEPAKVRLDAYPDMIFPGKLELIAPIGSAGSFSEKVRNFTAVFSIQGNDPKLMPDLSAAVDLDTTTQGSSLGASQ